MSATIQLIHPARKIGILQFKKARSYSKDLSRVRVRFQYSRLNSTLIWDSSRTRKIFNTKNLVSSIHHFQSYQSASIKIGHFVASSWQNNRTIEDSSVPAHSRASSNRRARNQRRRSGAGWQHCALKSRIGSKRARLLQRRYVGCATRFIQSQRRVGRMTSTLQVFYPIVF